MRTIEFLTFFLINIVLLSCDESSNYDAVRVIYNSSGYDVHVEVIASDSVEFDISNSDSLITEGTCSSGPNFGRFCNFGWTGSGYAEITFDSLRILRQDPTDCTNFAPQERCLAKDPDDGVGGWSRTTRDGQTYFIYEIVADDFANAEPL